MTGGSIRAEGFGRGDRERGFRGDRTFVVAPAAPPAYGSNSSLAFRAPIPALSEIGIFVLSGRALVRSRASRVEVDECPFATGPSAPANRKSAQRVSLLECTPKMRHKNKGQFSRGERCPKGSVVSLAGSSSSRL